MKRAIRDVMILTGLLAPLSFAAADGDAVRGKELYAVCQSCHGVDAEGNAAIGTPRLAGLQDWYLMSQLRKFRNKMRGADDRDHYGQSMVATATTLSGERALADVVAYIISLQPGAPAQAEIGGDPERGKDLYAACVQCHGTRGQGLRASGSGLATYNLDCPRLSGQNDRYLIRQLRNFQSGVRGYHPDDIEGRDMRGRVKPLYNDQMIKDVVAYIITLK